MSKTKSPTKPKKKKLPPPGRKGVPSAAFAKAVRDARENQGLTIFDLTQALGLGASTISKIETQQSSASLALAAKIADYLKLEQKLVDFIS